MDYSLLTEQQTQKRYYSLPQKLRDVLDSENNLESVRQICRAYHLNDGEKIMIVEQLVGLILLGFLSPNDLSSEISKNLHLNKKHSDDIASEIDRKIFAPIRADLEKVYTPPVVEAVVVKSPVAEEEALDLRKKIEADKRGPIQTIEAEERGKEAETEEPVMSSSIESRTSEAEPPKIISVEEKQREKTEELRPPRVNVPLVERLETAAPELPTEESKGPVIIHKETEFKPFSEDKKSLGGLFGFLRRKEKGEERKEEGLVKAEVEIGLDTKSHELEREIARKEPSGPPAVSRVEPPKMRVVHYTEFPVSANPFRTIEENEGRKAKNEERKIESKTEIKPPENLPKVEEKIQTEPPVATKVEPLDLRKPPVAKEEKKEAKSEEGEIIDLSAFK